MSPGKKINTEQSAKAIIIGICNFFSTAGKATFVAPSIDEVDAKEIARIKRKENNKKIKLNINKA